MNGRNAPWRLERHWPRDRLIATTGNLEQQTHALGVTSLHVCCRGFNYLSSYVLINPCKVDVDLNEPPYTALTCCSLQWKSRVSHVAYEGKGKCPIARHENIQSDSWFVDITVDDFLVLCGHRSSCQHGRYSQWLWCYGCFQILVNSHLWNVCKRFAILNRRCFCHWMAGDLNRFQAYVLHLQVRCSQPSGEVCCVGRVAFSKTCFEHSLM